MATPIMPQNPQFANAINAALQQPTQSAVMSMTSREIAELTGKRHADVLRDIDNLLKTLDAELRLGFQSSSYVDSTGKGNRQFVLDRDSSYCLVAGYDANSRMRIIKRWQELEAAVAQPSAGMKDPKLAAMVETLIRLDYLQQEQEALARRQDEVEVQLDETKDRVDALMGGDTWVTVKGYAAKNGYPGDRTSLSQIGRLAAKACRAAGTTPVEVPDEVWDTVKSYPREIVSAAFEEYYGKKRLNS